MRPLVLGLAEIHKLAAVRGWVEKHTLSLAELKASMESGCAVGDDDRRRCELPVGYRVAFSIEEHPSGWMRHLSVSVNGKQGACPNLFAIAAIAKELGFKQGIPGAEVLIYIEDEKGAHPAVNVMEKLA